MPCCCSCCCQSRLCLSARKKVGPLPEISAAHANLCHCYRLLSQMVPYKIVKAPSGDAWVEVSERKTHTALLDTHLFMHRQCTKWGDEHKCVAACRFSCFHEPVCHCVLCIHVHRLAASSTHHSRSVLSRSQR